VYKNAHRVFTKIWWVNDPFNMMQMIHINGKFHEVYNAELVAAYGRLFPKKKKIDLTKLPDDVAGTIHNKWSTRAMRYFLQKKIQYNLLDDWLQKHAPLVSLDGAERQVIYVSSTDAYRSQGSGAIRYAKGAVEVQADVLRKRNLPHEVVTVYGEPIKTLWGTVTPGEVQLWADLEPYQFDALQRTTAYTEDDWLNSCNKHRVNPKVYDPFYKGEL
jgi:hypothetical protein